MNIIDTVWWNAIGIILFIAVIGVCLYCLWDLKKEEEQLAAEEALNNSNTIPKWRTETIYLKKPLYIYPTNYQDVPVDPIATTSVNK